MEISSKKQRVLRRTEGKLLTFEHSLVFPACFFTQTSDNMDIILFDKPPTPKMTYVNEIYSYHRRKAEVDNFYRNVKTINLSEHSTELSTTPSLVERKEASQENIIKVPKKTVKKEKRRYHRISMCGSIITISKQIKKHKEISVVTQASQTFILGPTVTVANRDRITSFTRKNGSFADLGYLKYIKNRADCTTLDSEITEEHNRKFMNLAVKQGIPYCEEEQDSIAVFVDQLIASKFVKALVFGAFPYKFEALITVLKRREDCIFFVNEIENTKLPSETGKLLILVSKAETHINSDIGSQFDLVIFVADHDFCLQPSLRLRKVPLININFLKQLAGCSVLFDTETVEAMVEYSKNVSVPNCYNEYLKIWKLMELAVLYVNYVEEKEIMEKDMVASFLMRVANDGGLLRLTEEEFERVNRRDGV